MLVGIALGLLFFYSRSFATGNQDRIIRAEENRSYRLIGGILDSRLSRSQIIALRFADDVEYANLSKRILAENLDAKAIKRSVQQWKADHHRV